MGSCHCNLFSSKKQDTEERNYEDEIMQSLLKNKLLDPDATDTTDNTDTNITTVNGEDISKPDIYNTSHTDEIKNQENNKPPPIAITTTVTDANQSMISAGGVAIEETDNISSSENEDNISPLSDPNTPQGHATFQAFGSNEPWNPTSNQMEVIAIQSELNVLERKLSKTEEERPRRGSHLINKQSISEFTECEIEESQHQMEEQMEYLQKQYHLEKHNNTEKQNDNVIPNQNIVVSENENNTVIENNSVDEDNITMQNNDTNQEDIETNQEDDSGNNDK